MRRRSTRSSAKSSSEKSTDSPVTKSRNTRSRKRRSSSRSSVEDTEGRSTKDKVEKNDSQEVTSEDAESKENRRDKIKLVRSTSSSSDKQEHRRRSSDNHEDERDDKRLRKVHRQNSNKEDQEESEKREEKEDSEERGPKGKSKSKHKSKSDKTRQVSESKTHTQSEISENAQVTSQSPTHSSSNNPVTNAVVPVEDNNDHDDNNDKLTKEEEVANETVVENNESSPSNQRRSSTGNLIEENGNVEESSNENNSSELQDEDKKQTSELDKDQVQVSDEHVAENKSDEKDSAENLHSEGSFPESRSSGEAAEESGSVIEQHDIEMTEVEKSEENMEVDVSLNSICKEGIQELVETNVQIQEMKAEIADIFRTPNQSIKAARKRKWGNSLAGLDLMRKSLAKINVETIRGFCPNVKFLEEEEVKLEIKERRKSVPIAELKEKKPERKVSIDYKSDGEHPKFERRTSSNETEEQVEPEVDNSHIIAMNRKISIVEDTASKLRPPPSPAKNPLSAVLFITNLVRPFTLKQLKDLLERTGKIRENGFWTDRVKSKCYVHYETEEEAESTRNALHGVNWPVGNAKKLSIEYGTPEDLENARNPPPPVATAPAEPVKVLDKENEVPPKQIKEEEERVGKPREREKVKNSVREWDAGKEINRRRSYSREREERDRRRHRRSATPIDYIKRKQLKEEEDIPQKRMDDLFRKTKASPSIYWLPLTPEEIAIKEQQRLERMAEHKRRMEESSSRNRSEYGRGAAYRRRY